MLRSRVFSFFGVGLLVLACMSLTAAPPKALRVGVFKGLGGDPECITDAVEALKLDAGIMPELVTAADIMGGRLEKLDALVLPGGSGSRQMGNLGPRAQEKVLDFVRVKGRGVVGLCAGAYMLSDTPAYPCLRLGGHEAIDRDHDERGNGLVKFSFTPATFEVFPEFKGMEQGFMQYFEGPVLVPVAGARAEVLAIMQSDVHLKNDAPANMTNGKAFLVNAETGKGRVFLAVGHPENTPGYRWMLPRMVRWTLRKPLVSYAPEVVRVKRASAESLFDPALRARERAFFQELVAEPSKGGAEKKLAAIAALLEMRSWGAKERLEGALRDGDCRVRLAAAEALVELEHTLAIPDVKAAAESEPDATSKIGLLRCHRALLAMTHGR